ncbi:MAG: pilus assembly protein N-terminal domain-containing protein [Alphaproteobacteria bacterium]
MRGLGLVVPVIVSMIVAALLSGTPVQAADGGNPLVVTWNKARVLRLPQDAKVVIVSDPSVIDVNLETPRLVILRGTNVGESDLIVLDGAQNEVFNAVVMVVPELHRHVSVTRECAETKGACAAEEELMCGPRCARVATPGLQAGGNGAMGSEPPALPPAPATGDAASPGAGAGDGTGSKDSVP